jgi:hypothetical protein
MGVAECPETATRARAAWPRRLLVYQDRTGVRRRLRCGEILSFLYVKAKNVAADHAGKWASGDVWT